MDDLITAFAGGEDGIGVECHAAAVTRKEGLPFPALVQLRLEDEDAQIALERLCRCSAGNIIKLGNSVQAAYGPAYEHILVEDVYGKGRVDRFATSLAEGPASKPFCIRNRRIHVND